MDIKIANEVYLPDEEVYEYTLEVDQDTFEVLQSLYGDDITTGLSEAFAKSVEDGTLEKWVKEIPDTRFDLPVRYHRRRLRHRR